MAERIQPRRSFLWTGFDGVRVVLGAILLTAAPPRKSSGFWSARPGATAVTALLVMLGISTTLVLATNRPGQSLSDGLWIEPDRVIVVQPQAWRGAEFPLFGLAGCGERLRQGVWNVIVYAADCSKCGDAISWAMEHQRRVASNGGERPGLALLSLPPHEDKVACRDAGTHPAAQPDGSRQWFMKTPLILRLSDGRVTAVSSDVAGVLSDGESFHPTGDHLSQR